MSTPIKNGLRSGAISSIIVIFITIINFLQVISGMLGKLLGSDTSGMIPIINLIIILFIIGFFSGLSSAKEREPDTWRAALLSGLYTGIFSGIVLFVFSLVIGAVAAKGIDLRSYLSFFAPATIQQYMFNLEVIDLELAVLVPGVVFSGSIYHLVLQITAAVIGSLFARGFVRGEWRKNLMVSLSQSTIVTTGGSGLKQFFNNRYTKYGFFIILIVLLFVLPRVWGSYWNYIMGTVGIYVLLGLGLNIIVGLSGQLVLGYVAFFAIGAYSFALLTAPVPHNLLWNFWPAVGAAIFLAAVAGLLLGLPILNLRGDYLAIVTLGFGEIIRNLIRSDLLTPLTLGPRGVREIAQPTLFGNPFSSDIDFMYLIIVAVLILIYITYRIQNSRTGRAWLSIKDDETVARASGVNVYKYKLLALSLGAAFAGLGGAIFASRNLFTGPEDHILMVSINVLCLIIVGGMGSIPGVILGAFALKGIPEMLRDFEIYRMLAFGALLVVMMIVRPEGLWPTGRPKLEKYKVEDEPELQTLDNPSESEGA